MATKIPVKSYGVLEEMTPAEERIYKCPDGHLNVFYNDTYCPDPAWELCMEPTGKESTCLKKADRVDTQSEGL